MSATAPRVTDDASSRGWNEDGDREIVALEERSTGWHWMHSQSAMHYRKIFLWMVIPNAILEGALALINMSGNENISRFWVGVAEFGFAIIGVVKSNIDVKEYRQSHASVAKLFGSIVVELRGVMSKKVEDREPYADFIGRILDTYTSGMNMHQETIPQRIRNNWLNNAGVTYFPEILIPPKPIGEEGIAVPKKKKSMEMMQVTGNMTVTTAMHVKQLKQSQKEMEELKNRYITSSQDQVMAGSPADIIEDSSVPLPEPTRPPSPVSGVLVFNEA